MKIQQKRIGNLMFRSATYLCDPPERASWSIDMFYENHYYAHKDEYPEDPTDSNYRIDPKYHYHRIHKSCFETEECSFTIASFEYDAHESCWEVHFVGNRPIEYLNTPELREAFWELLKYGDEQLSKEEDK